MPQECDSPTALSKHLFESLAKAVQTHSTTAQNERESIGGGESQVMMQ